MNHVHIRPNPGFQEPFLSTSADIAIGGGHAGAGKTRALLHEPMRHVKVGSFRCITFRRKTVELLQPGGLWEEAEELYVPLGARTRGGQYMDVSWPSGARFSFSHMQYEHDRFAHQGLQAPLICFDELTHFTWRQFQYLVFSRGRQMSGQGPRIKRYVRATCNPDADSWVAKMLAWWIDQNTGLAIPGRSGVLRWFIRSDNQFQWADTVTDPTWGKAARKESEADAREELAERFPDRFDDPDSVAQSMTFILGKLEDNPYTDTPEYRASLADMDHVESERLLGGNWKIRELPTGLIFHNLNQRTMVYTDSDLPVGAREKWPLFAGIDFGTAHYKTVMPGCLVQFAPDPHYWIDFETCLMRTDFANFLDDFDEKRQTCGNWKWVYGDPAGRQHHKDNTTWVMDIRARGWAFAAIGDIFAPQAAHRRDPYGQQVKSKALIINSQPWKRQAIRIVNGIMAEGRIHIHERCQHMRKGLANWRWDLPADMTDEQLEELNRQDVDVRHDAHSDKGMALLYLVLGMEAWIRAQRTRPDDEPLIPTTSGGTFDQVSPDAFGQI